MTTTIFILIMVFGGNTTQSGFAVIQSEFDSFATCEIARKEIAKAHGIVVEGYGYGMQLRTQGCYRK